LPHINLNAGPDLNGGLTEVASSAHWGNTEPVTAPHLFGESPMDSSSSQLQYDSAATPNETPYIQSINPQPTVQNYGLKRPVSSIHGSSNRESSVEQDTRSVALDLGLLSLNSDSRQLHYLGSSSGPLFASLVQAGRANYSKLGGPKAATSPQETDETVGAGHEIPVNSNLVQFDVMRAAISSLYGQLRKVSQCPS
jgi:hypothetical protein